MKRACLACAPFAAILIGGCFDAAPEPTAIATFALAPDGGADPDPCVTSGAFHDVRAYAPAPSGGEIIATGPALGSNGAAAVQKVDASCQPVWTFRAAPGESLWILRVAADAAGNVFVAGAFSSAAEPDADLRRDGAILLMKLDAQGHPVWRDGSHAGGRLSRVVLAPGGEVVVSGRSHDGQGEKADFVARYDANGQVRWRKAMGDGRARAADLAVGDDGETVIGGRFSGAFDFGGGVLTPAHAPGNVDTFDAFLVKYGPAGEHRWSKRFGDDDSQSIDKVTVDGTGRVTVRGRGSGTIDLGGGPITLGQDGTFAGGLDGAGRWLWSGVDTGG